MVQSKFWNGMTIRVIFNCTSEVIMEYRQFQILSLMSERNFNIKLKTISDGSERHRKTFSLLD